MYIYLVMKEKWKEIIKNSGFFLGSAWAWQPRKHVRVFLIVIVLSCCTSSHLIFNFDFLQWVTLIKAKFFPVSIFSWADFLLFYSDKIRLSFCHSLCSLKAFSVLFVSFLVKKVCRKVFRKSYASPISKSLWPVVESLKKSQTYLLWLRSKLHAHYLL